MKFLNITLLIVFLILGTSCETSEDNNIQASRSTEKIEVYIDGSTTPLLFNNNILAKDNAMPASSGFTNVFTIDAENDNANPFKIKFYPTLDPAPFVIATPTLETVTGMISNRLQIDGITFDDTANNSLTFDYLIFDQNVGDTINILISGTYYEVLDPLPHSIFIDIHIERD